MCQICGCGPSDKRIDLIGLERIVQPIVAERDEAHGQADTRAEFVSKVDFQPEQTIFADGGERRAAWVDTDAQFGIGE